MSHWTQHQRYALQSAWTHMRGAKSNFIFNCIVIAIALALPILGLSLIENIRPVAKELTIEPEMSVFCKPEIPTAQAQSLQASIQQTLNNLQIQAKLTFISKEEALHKMKANSQLAQTLDTLGSNPLPDAYVLNIPTNYAHQLEGLATQLRSIDGIDVVQIDSAWVKRLAAFMHVAQWALLFLAAALSLVVIVVVFNATRLQVLAHQEEIKVSRIIGATDDFIIRPYAYAGATMGAMAALLALGLVALLLIPINQNMSEFTQLYASDFQFQALDVWWSLIIVVISKLLCFMGAYFAVKRQIRKLPTT